MLYAQFYEKGAVTGQPVEACGDRSVIILDKRFPMSSNRAANSGPVARS